LTKIWIDIKKLGSILKYMSQNIGEIPKKPERIVEKAGLKYHIIFLL